MAIRAAILKVAEPAPKKGEGESKRQSLSRFNYDEYRCVTPPFDLDLLAGVYNSNIPHKASVDAKAYNTCGLGYEIVEEEEEDELDPKEAKKVKKWLEKMARRGGMTLSELMVACKIDEENVGFGAIEVTRNGKGEPDGLFHVPAATLRRRQPMDGWVQKVEERYTFFLDYPLTPEEAEQKMKEADLSPEIIALDMERWNEANHIIVIGRKVSTSQFYPLPDHIPALGAIVGDEAAERYQQQFFDNNASPRYAVLVNGGLLTKDTRDFLLQYLGDVVKGGSQKVLLLETEQGDATITLQPLNQYDKQDAAFVEYRKSTTGAVIMAHRVSPTKVTIVDNANLANSREQDKTFKEQTVRPSQERWEARLNWLIEEAKYTLVLRFAEMDLGDEQQKAETDKVYFNAYTNNEVRQLRGLQPFNEENDTEDPNLIEWGERPYGTTYSDPTQNPMLNGAMGGGGGFGQEPPATGENGYDDSWMSDYSPELQNLGQDNGGSETTEMPAEITKRRWRQEHDPWVREMRRLGIQIDRIVENAGANGKG